MAKKKKEKSTEGDNDFPAEEELEQVENEIEEETAPPIDILERISDNLENIRAELEKQNKSKLRENVRLAVLIVLFAVPLSFMVNILSSYYAERFIPLVGEGGWHSNLHGLVIILCALCFLLIVFRVYSPLMQTIDDPEVKDLIRKLREEEKKK